MAEMFTQGPNATVQRGTATQTAQNAQLDAQLEIEAKKAALRGLQESNAGGPAKAPAAPEAPAAPALPGTARTTIMIEKDGQTIVLENPSADQLRQVGLSTQPPLSTNPMDRLDPGQVLTLGVMAMLSGVAIIALLVSVFKRSRGASAPSGESKEMAARMARIENAIESVAVEVERVSEAQRFTTKVLSEGVARNVNVPEIMTAVLKNRGGA